MRVLAVGDVCGNLGTKTALRTIPKLKQELNIDMVIVNGENSADGNGVTPESADLLFAAGADVITGGNHSFRRKEILPVLDQNEYLLRPHNMEGEFGKGYSVLDLGKYSVGVINLSGQIYLEHLKSSNPFICVDEIIKQMNNDGIKHIFVDFHAEATSEKRAMGFYLDGKVSAVFGTHTHIQTADGQILPKGTGYITDLGMTGPLHSVLGVKKEIIINRLRDGDQSKFEFADGESIFCGCLFETDNLSGLSTAVTPIYIKGELY